MTESILFTNILIKNVVCEEMFSLSLMRAFSISSVAISISDVHSVSYTVSGNLASVALMSKWLNRCEENEVYDGIIYILRGEMGICFPLQVMKAPGSSLW